MDKLDIYEGVNKCNSFMELREFLLKIPSIESRNYRVGKQDGEYRAERLDMAIESGKREWLTRTYGIRQQAIYIKHYYG